MTEYLDLPAAVCSCVSTRIGELRQFAGLQSMVGVLGLGSGRRRVFAGLNLRGGGAHHQQDNLHFLLWANGARPVWTSVACDAIAPSDSCARFARVYRPSCTRMTAAATCVGSGT